MTTSLSDRRPALFAPAPTCALPPPAEHSPDLQLLPLALLGLGTVALLAYVGSSYGARPAVLLALGLGLGLALFHSRFGFTSAWRQLVSVGNGQGVRAHAVLLGTTATLFALIIGTGTGLFGSTPGPSAGPLGVGLVVGAFLFGIGMQLGGSCASGTLFAVGSGQLSIVFTLGGFIIGSVLYAWAFPLVDDLPALPAFVLADHVGWFGSWAITIAVLVGIVLISRAVQSRRRPPPVAPVPTARRAGRIWRGSWPLLAGALVLAMLGGAVLLVSGGAWGITSAFTLWGSKLLQLVGVEPENWAYWQPSGRASSLAGPILTDTTSLTNIGIMLGAAVAAALAGAFVLRQRIPANVIATAVLGGIIMGIGARLASGCNIGAYLAGVSSGSLSGWIWGLAALGGTWAGIKARALFGLGNPKPSDSVC